MPKVQFDFKDLENDQPIGEQVKQKLVDEASAKPAPAPQEPPVEDPQEEPITEPASAEPEEPAPQEPPSEEPTPGGEITDDALLEYLNKKNGSSFSSLEDFSKSLVKEVPVEVQPTFDDETTAFLKFKKETGRGMADWIKLQESVDDKPDMYLAMQQIRRENEGLSLTDSQAQLLLAEKLGMEPDDFADMDERSKLRLSVVANEFKKHFKQEQDKYRKPLASEPDPSQIPPDQGEMVTVMGQELSKAEYDRERQQYISTNEQAVKAIDRDVFSIEVDGKSGKSKVEVGYVYTDEDKQSMLSLTESVDQIIQPFIKEGKVDQKSLNLAVRWMDANFRKKAITAMMQQARSAGVDEVIKKANNIDFDSQGKPHKEKKPKDGYGELPTDIEPGGMRVKYPFNI